MVNIIFEKMFDSGHPCPFVDSNKRQHKLRDFLNIIQDFYQSWFNDHEALGKEPSDESFEPF